MNAKNRFCRMLRIVARLRRTARTIPFRSPLTKVTPALSIATSVPVPIAMPTCAIARHRDEAALRLQLLDDESFLLGQHFRLDAVYAQLARYRLGRGAVVAGQ